MQHSDSIETTSIAKIVVRSKVTVILPKIPLGRRSKVHQSKHDITIDQAAYTAKMLDKAGMAGCNPYHVLPETNYKLRNASSTPLADAYRGI